MDLTDAKWRRSSYSGSNGGNCVELAGLTWHKSSHSASNGGDCVELADATGTVADAVAVRDSKDPDGPVLLLTRAALRTAVQSATDTH
ncbi:DUF397 domain-containing protein [Actinomadura madurae]|uniref:DUF397 domain-containing protein n=1 Tax=Actinomadura madurae TaxID=1993 RepID=UPI002026857A|nr:DUF397 domain-containing protein [Actinomadura madurae]MCP9951561.1 DUF397 domain-containing protein [Actinomadura madurae]MCP9968332.1 DUF397 domain-containing protein [Actinomadura madurae]MCP9980798.1 DUF397 domain-containing protein [Actinomadura madurae]MCQ0007704.1 DUF397 domain-containing protein [Actinomadura madurae]MCQ0016992.1 DUF397 domain-containing protein [Actinomadura madurae]